MIKPYYQDEWVAIYHGDCREILPELPRVDLVLTDPPYAVTSEEWDDKLEFKYFVGDWLKMHLIKAPIVIWFYSILWLPELLNNADGKYHRMLIWDKSFASTDHNHIFYSFDPIIVFGSKEAISRKGKDASYSQAIIKVGNPSAKLAGHPTPKPTEVMDWLITHYSNSGDLILDPFLGSGTSAYCAKKLNRKCIGIEIEEKYCEIAARRCSQGVFNLGDTTK